MTEVDESMGTARKNGPGPVVNLAALEPLYQTFEEPCRYRAPGEGKGDPAPHPRPPETCSISGLAKST